MAEIAYRTSNEIYNSTQCISPLHVYSILGRMNYVFGQTFPCLSNFQIELLAMFSATFDPSYFTSRARAITPVSSGAEALVPMKPLVHFDLRSVVIYSNRTMTKQVQALL